jgi:hypothetical protein
MVGYAGVIKRYWNQPSLVSGHKYFFRQIKKPNYPYDFNEVTLGSSAFLGFRPRNFLSLPYDRFSVVVS